VTVFASDSSPAGGAVSVVAAVAVGAAGGAVDVGGGLGGAARSPPSSSPPAQAARAGTTTSRTSAGRIDGRVRKYPDAMRGALVAAAAAVALALPPQVGGGAADAVLLAAGDVASCRSDGDEATARLLDDLAGTVAVLGDAVYERGTSREFARCYAPSWGRHRARTRPALGNHEYGTPGAAGYFRYFGRRAGRPPGYYAYSLGSWRVLVLNTNCRPAGGCGTGSPQARWLRAELARSRGRCVVAYGHHPRLSSGLHGPDASIDALWRALADGGAELYLAGHDHHYERFAPVRGVRQFVVGTGGRSLYPIVRRLRASRVRRATTYGVLRLELRVDSYAWSFLSTSGSFSDSGSAACRPV
jgi:hypothetical protein